MIGCSQPFLWIIYSCLTSKLSDLTCVITNMYNQTAKSDSQAANNFMPLAHPSQSKSRKWWQVKIGNLFSSVEFESFSIFVIDLINWGNRARNLKSLARLLPELFYIQSYYHYLNYMPSKRACSYSCVAWNTSCIWKLSCKFLSSINSSPMVITPQHAEVPSK